MLRLPILAFGFVILMPSAFAALEFSGYMRTKEGAQFVLKELASGAKSGWLSIGDNFQGHKVVSFDEKSETIVLEVSGKTLQLVLKDSRVLEGKGAPPQRIEVNAHFSAKGDFTIGNRTVSADGVLDLVRKQTEAGQFVALFIHMPDDPSRESAEAFKRFCQALGRSGLKKWSLTVIDGGTRQAEKANKAPEPTPGPVTPRALESDLK